MSVVQVVCNFLPVRVVAAGSLGSALDQVTGKAASSQQVPVIGLPTERSPIDVKKNIDFLIGLDPDYGQISILTLYPNTAIYDQAVEKGLIEANRWQEWALDPKPGFVVDHWEEFMPHSTIVKLQKNAYRRFYFRPKYILRSALKTASIYELKSKASGAMKLLRTNKRSA